jgi:hypothetical protein
VAAPFAPDVGSRFARSLVVDLGPNDAEYVRGFREDWERDGRTRFHWTSPAAALTLPFRLSGEGFRIQARVRRHLIEPARVRLTTEGRLVHDFSIEADTRIPYRIESVPLPPLSGAEAFRLDIVSASENPRPLGVAIDWVEIERAGAADIGPLPATKRHAAIMVAVALVLPWLAGSRWLGLGHALVVLLLVIGGTASHPIAAERVLRTGWASYAAVGLFSLAVLTWARRRAGLSPFGAAALCTLVLVGLGVRLAILLHPQFFYPDVRVHAVFALTFARQGLEAFLQNFTANQFRYSLGLQLENGHWYAFPYPPGFYVVAGLLVRYAACAPEIAVALSAAGVNALSALPAYGIARQLGLAPGVALASGAAVPLLPLFITRLSLGYFPAMAGQFADALVLLCLLSRRRTLSRPATIALLGSLIAGALLVYTQSLVNLGLLLPAFLLLQLASDRAGWRRHLGLALAGVLGALLALLLFYGRYVPIVLAMHRGEPMAGEEILLERLARQERVRVAADEEAETGVDDPYVGPDVDPIRGLRKAGSRLWIFYGPFSLAVSLGLLLLISRTQAELARFALAWGSVYLWLNLGSAGLPGPNLLRYNKDLEIVAPLFCVCLGTTGAWLWERARWLALVYGVGYWGWGLQRALSALDARIVVER